MKKPIFTKTRAPKLVKLTLRPIDLEGAEPRKANNCPVARCIRRQFGENVKVTATTNLCWITGPQVRRGIGATYAPSEPLKAFMRGFDRGLQQLLPQVFELTLERRR